MENVLSVADGLPGVGSLDRAPLKAWTMVKARSNSEETARDQGSAADVLTENEHDAQLASGFTLRVKPDRRRVQLPISVELDRRRTA
jgi:hypothetical protein